MRDYTETAPGLRRPIGFTEVTLRDGEQQDKRHDVMPVKDRIAVFDRLIDTGIDRIEIGHLGNPYDIEFAESLVSHINQKEMAGDNRYSQVKLQVLFGSQAELIDSGIDALGDFDPDRVIVHVYDRASPHLRNLAARPYTNRESATRVIDAAAVVADRGYKHFSISGEGTVDPDLRVDEAVDDFYLPIIEALEERGASSINVNLPNTFGSSLGGEWGEEGLRVFNARIKRHNGAITTSIHAHNDYNSAAEYVVTALKAGFDYVEGTLIGMGERAGNVKLSDVMVLLIEEARTVAEIRAKGEAVSRIAQTAVRSSVWIDRVFSEQITANLGNWYVSSEAIGDIYDTANRFHQTSLGNQEAYGAGSGPHAHANQEMLRDPANKPLWRNYGRVALIHAMLGRPEARQIIAVDPGRIRAITLATHAAGGSTARVLDEQIVECDDTQRQESIQQATDLITQIMEVIETGAPLPASPQLSEIPG